MNLVKTFLTKILQDKYIYSFFFIFQFINFISFVPILVDDSGGYLLLSDIDLSKSFEAQWNYYRTPLFPFIYKLISFIFGKSANTVIIIPFFFGLIGILLNYWSAKILTKSKIYSFIVLCLLMFHPYVIIFQHTFLMETGLFFFISLVHYLVIKSIEIPHKLDLNIFLAYVFAGIGYYLKTPLFYLIIPLTIGYLFIIYIQKGKDNIIKHLSKILIFLFITNLIIYPWNGNEIVKENSKKNFPVHIYIGLVEQAVIKPEDPLIVDKNKYINLINECSENNILFVDGTQSCGEFSRVVDSIVENNSKNTIITFFRVILSNPKGYLKGFLNNIILMMHLKNVKSESAMNLVHFLKGEETWNSIKERNQVWVDDVKQNYLIIIKKGKVKNLFMQLLQYTYLIMIPLFFIVFFISLITSIIKFKLNNIILHLFALFWISLFLVTLAGQERYFFPVHGLLIIIFVSFIQMILNKFYMKAPKNI